MQKNIVFRVDENLRANFKVAAAMERKTMAEIMTAFVVKFVEETFDREEADHGSDGQRKSRKR